MFKVVEHSLQVMAEEFQKINKPKISKLKVGYSANATLLFNSWLKDIGMCIFDCSLMDHQTVQLLKDFTTEHTCGAVTFYLEMNEEWRYSKLIESLRTFFKTGKTFPSLLSDFLWRTSEAKGTNELQILTRKVIGKWKSQVDEGLKLSLPKGSGTNTFAAMTSNLFKTAPQSMTFTGFWVECIAIYGTRSRKTTKATISIYIVKIKNSDAAQPVKSGNQLYRKKMKAKKRDHNEITKHAKSKIKNLKAASVHLDSTSIKETMTQAMTCMYATNKGPSEKMMALIVLGQALFG